MSEVNDRVLELAANLERLRCECLELNDSIVLLARQLDLPASVLANALREVPVSMVATALGKSKAQRIERRRRAK